MRVKLVIISRIAGARERTVSRMMICIAAEKFSRLVRSGSWRSTPASGLSVEIAAEPGTFAGRTSSAMARRGNARTKPIRQTPRTI